MEELIIVCCNNSTSNKDKTKAAGTECVLPNISADCLTRPIPVPVTGACAGEK